MGEFFKREVLPAEIVDTLKHRRVGRVRLGDGFQRLRVGVRTAEAALQPRRASLQPGSRRRVKMSTLTEQKSKTDLAYGR